MKVFLVLVAVALTVDARRGRPDSATEATTTTTTTTTATTTTTTTTTTASETDDDYVTRAKALIDSGECSSVSTGDTCGSDATSYYKTFEYDGRRIIVSSGAPDHEAEEDAVKPNPNLRCERWQYVSLPLSPEVGSSAKGYDLGTTGFVSSGGVMFDHRSNYDGSLAAYYEWDSLDSCLGHSNSDMQYHYHAVPACTGSSTDFDACEHLGYMNDGFPLYGYCSVDGVQLKSCYTLVDSTMDEADADNFDDYYWDEDAYNSGSCQLDEANGYTFGSGYGYVVSDTFPYVPPMYKGTELATPCSLEV